MARHLWTSCPQRCLGVSYLARRVHRLDHRRRESAWLIVFGLLRPRHRLGASQLGCRARRLDHSRRESSRLVIFALLRPWHCFGVSCLAIACGVSVIVGVRVLGSTSFDPSPSASPWYLLPRPSRLARRVPRVYHRWRETARLVICGLLRRPHRLGASYLGRRAHRLDHRRRENTRPIVFALLRPQLCLGVSYLGCRVLRLGRCRRESAQFVILDPSPSPLPWCLSPRPSRALSRTPSA